MGVEDTKKQNSVGILPKNRILLSSSSGSKFNFALCSVGGVSEFIV